MATHLPISWMKAFSNHCNLNAQVDCAKAHNYALDLPENMTLLISWWLSAQKSDSPSS